MFLLRHLEDFHNPAIIVYFLQNSYSRDNQQVPLYILHLTLVMRIYDCIEINTETSKQRKYRNTETLIPRYQSTGIDGCTILLYYGTASYYTQCKFFFSMV